MSSVSPFTIGMVTLPTDPSVQVSGSITRAGGQELYQVTLDTQGLLVASVEASGIDTLLSLENTQANVLIQSEGISPTDPTDRIAQHLPAGTYFIAVSDSTGVGGFSLSTTFTASLAPGQAITETQGSYSVATADLNGDGKADLIVPDYFDNQILINDGNGDGTFQPPVAIPVGVGPIDVLAADLFGNGDIDLVVVDQLSDDLTILKGDGRGDFQVSQVLPTLGGPVDVVAGDFSGDGRMDLAVADQAANGVELFRNQGNGTFVESHFIGSISSPSALTVANLNGDGKADLAVASSGSGNLILLDGQGNDQFSELANQLPVGPGTSDVIAANFSGSKVSDLAAVSPVSGTISIFHFDGFAYRLVDTIQAGNTPERLAVADFNGDGKLDLAVDDYGSNQVSVFLSNGPDSFGLASTVSTGAGPIGLASADFNGDSYADLVTSDYIGLTVSVLLNNGNATFTGPPPQPPLAGPDDVIVADLTGNGIDDLIVPDFGLNVVEIFLGRGDGTFRSPIEIPAGLGPEDVAVGDFTGDGIPDLAVVDDLTNTLMILKGNGNGTFEPIETLATSDGPGYIKTADLDADGHLDLVVADYLGNTIDVFYGRGDGTFDNAVSYPVGIGPGGIAISDLNGDGRLDIAVSDSGSNDVDIFMATGPRTYAAPISDPAGDQPWFVAAGDFNGDGRPDLVVADGSSSPSVISLLVNNGDGTFQAPVGIGVGADPYALVIGDFNGDGNLDIVTGNDGDNTVSVLMGHGNGTFSPVVTLPTGSDPYGLAVGDFNGEGLLDLVAVNYQSSDLTVYLNQGNGTFASPETIPLISPDLPTISAYLEGNGVPQVLVANPEAGTISIFNSQGDGTLQLINTIDVGGSPSGMAVGDFNGDGRPDLAVTDAATGEVLILLGLGNGSFESPVAYSVGKSPCSPIVGDFTHNGILDIAVADTDSNQVSILYGNGNGTFQPAVDYPTGIEPISLFDEDFTGDGTLELGTINRTSLNVTALDPTPQGTFTIATFSLDGIAPSAIVSGDFNGDGLSDTILVDQSIGMLFVEINTGHGLPSALPINVGVGNYLIATADLYENGESDLVLANTETGVVTILSGWTNGRFKYRKTIDTNITIAGISLVDLNNDGLPDILVTQSGTGEIETYLSGGKGVFSTPESTVPLPHPSPIVFPLSSGVSDIININNDGSILERLGIVGAEAEFGAPMSATNGTGIAVRDFALVQTAGYPEVASLDTERPLIYLQNTVVAGAAGASVLQLPGEGNYTRLISDDLFGTGLDDLVVINRTLNELVIYQQISSGVFRQYGNPIPAGFGPTDVILANLTPGDLPDLVVSDGSSGEITLIGRTAQGGFFNQAVLSAGLATAGTVLLPDGLNRSSPDEPVGVTAGVFGPSGLTDVVVVDHGTDRISILQGVADGGLSSPSLALTYSTGLDPIQVVAAPLTRNGLLDLVVLNEGSDDISIFLNNGHGGFTALPRVDAGDDPTSLTVSDVTGDGVPDLVVSNSNGDILILQGNGDGTFQPYERADDTVNLAVGDLTGDGQDDFVLTNTSQDLLSVQTSSSTSTVGFIQGRGNGLLAPGPVAIADLTGNGISDLIVTNTGGNDVLVYLGLGNGQFAAPQEFFTGTSPVGLTVADLTGNGLPDLIVANSGSNDVTILLGTIDAQGNWTMVPGPRLKAGEHPVSTTVADLYGDGEQDIVVVNQNSNDITILRPRGGGFYDDNDPLTLPTGSSPAEAFVGHFSSSTEPGIVILNSLSNNMTFYANVDSAASTLSSGGTNPVAGVMGDFNNDGFSDLAVADNGDSRIVLFYGGINGMTLAQTILLGTSTHPTDLVVSPTTGGGLQFYVGAEGQDHAIAVTINASAGSTIEIIVTTPIDGNGELAMSSSLDRLSGNNSSSSGEFNAVIFEQSGIAAGVQSQESVSAGATTGSATAASSMTSAVVTTLSLAAQTLFSPSTRSLVGLLDNLVQLAQGQTAEILPLGKNEMAAVAVLLSTSSMTDKSEDRGSPPLPVPTEDDALSTVSISSDPGSSSPSRLDRFVANLGDLTVDFSDELIDKPVRSPEFGADWVWHRRPGDPSSITASFARPLVGRFSPKLADQPGEIPLAETPAPHASMDESAALADSPPTSFPTKVAVALAAIIALTVGIMAVKRGKLNRLVGFCRRKSRSVPPQTIPGRVKEGDRIDSIRSSVKPRNSEDLPPWLQGPKSTRYRQASSDRSLATFFRKRSQCE